MRLGGNLHIKIARRAAAVADLTLGSHADAHAITNAGRDIYGEIAALLHAAIATTVVTRISNDFTEALALRARAGGHNVAQEAALHLLNLAHAATTITGNWLGLGGRTRALAAVTEHSGIDGDLLLQAGIGLFQANGGAQQGVIARLHARARAAGATCSTAEELSEDVA